MRQMCIKGHRPIASTGGDLEGTGGRSFQKIEVGDGSCIRLPNIWRSSVIVCVRKYELSKKVFSGNVREERATLYVINIYLTYKISDSKDMYKTEKIRSTTKKSSDILASKLNFVL